jgi:hypothetical protein
MTHFNKIEIHDKEILDKFLCTKNYDISEFNFTYLFMWAEDYNICYKVINEYLCIRGITYNKKNFYFMPLGTGENLGEVIDILLETWNYGSEFPFFRSLTTAMIEEIENVRPGLFNYLPEKSSFDYVYLSQDLIGLSGNKFHSKRNHINNFSSNYTYKYLELDKTHIDACINAAKNWYPEEIYENDSLIAAERNAINRMLKNYNELKFQGGILTVNDNIVAFTYGEKLNSDTFVVNIEKANTNYKGSYAMINNLFSAAHGKDYKYINRQEDIGLEGLRKSKLSYHPIKMVEKNIAFLKRD